MSWIVAIIAGAVCGALAGAMLLGLPAAFYKGPSALISSASWAVYLTFVGAVFGILPGTIIGLLVRLTRVDKPGGAIIGALVGLAIAAMFFLKNFGEEKPINYSLVISFLIIPCGALTGLFLTWLLKLPFLK